MLRVISTFVVCLFHISIHFKLTTGVEWLDTTLSVGAVFMTLFFLLSGFTLYYGYRNTEYLNDNGKNLKKFYLKRAVRILPAYYAVLIIHVAFKLSYPQTGKQLLLLIFADVFGIQAFSPKTFNILGNGGTWFISAILFCYFVFPVLQQIIRKLSVKAMIWATIAAYVLSVFPGIFNLSFPDSFAYIYINPVFRLSEFALGMLMAEYMIRQNTLAVVPGEMTLKLNDGWRVMAMLGGAILYFITTNLLYKSIKGNYTAYDAILIPIFLVWIIAFSGISTKTLLQICSCKIIKFLSEISFSFYLTQGLANRVCGILISKQFWNMALGMDKKVLIVSVTLNFIFALLLHYTVEKPIGKYLNLN